MIDGFTKKYILMFIVLIKMQVGILNGISQNLVNLQNMKKDNFMIGTAIVGIDLTLKKISMTHHITKLGNYL